MRARSDAVTDSGSSEFTGRSPTRSRNTPGVTSPAAVLPAQTPSHVRGLRRASTRRGREVLGTARRPAPRSRAAEGSRWGPGDPPIREAAWRFQARRHARSTRTPAETPSRRRELPRCRWPSRGLDAGRCRPPATGGASLGHLDERKDRLTPDNDKFAFADDLSGRGDDVLEILACGSACASPKGWGRLVAAGRGSAAAERAGASAASGAAASAAMSSSCGASPATRREG
jgi:hypothetical protein